MFLLIEASQPGYWCAKISDDNMLIQWEKGPNGAWSEPPWEKFYMPRYDKEFQAAMSDYNIARAQVAEYRELPRATNQLAVDLMKQEWRDSGGKVLGDG